MHPCTKPTFHSTSMHKTILSCRMYPIAVFLSWWSVHTWQNNTCPICLQCSDLFQNWKKFSLEITKEIYFLYFFAMMIMCIGFFFKMCLSILHPDLQVKIADYIRQYKERKEVKAINCLLLDLKIGYFVKLINLESSVGNPMSWILSHSERKQPFHVAIRGLHERCSHCIGVCVGEIFDVIAESSTKLSAKTLEETLGEKVNSIVWCKISYPLSWCCTKNIKLFTYQENQYEFN